eukprot:Plantae.Rhodophyta-Hildenbrandia_rubra.ctg2917.p1 GENE.Plantae.Rhodophyta-Hildenbrandia_rubra.ctg2917~~Plantae.Rhodophyta-Hildenbrandia_rubra.ctg2917.p1  ORF type:complete len:696 (-),score=131.50 Plantae.Rhodophyta-Hildenbrandia_rubra.ctg2917:5935-8022(-)
MSGNGEVDLQQLQWRCRKDPESYREEFLTQRRHFSAQLSTVRLRPATSSPHLCDLATFVAHATPSYGDAGREVGVEVVKLLEELGPVLETEVRRCLVRCVSMLKGRKCIKVDTVLPLFFGLLGVKDKTLRKTLSGCILRDCGRGDAASLKKMQGFLFSMIQDENEGLVKRGLAILVELYRRGVWMDPRTVNVVSLAVFHPAAKVTAIATHFLLDSSRYAEDEQSESDSDDEGVGLEKGGRKKTRDNKKAAEMLRQYNKTGKKSTRKRKKVERQILRRTRQRGKRQNSAEHAPFSALVLLNDPQSFAERLFSDIQHRRRNESFALRLALLNLLTRIVGTHQVLLLNLYPYLQRYLQPQQQDVTKVLAYLIQACHDLIPPDALFPTVRWLANTFVSDRCSPQVSAAGLNTIRGICSRVPLAILDSENEDKPVAERESALLQELAEYKNSKDKGVAIAARSLVAVYREAMPTLLRKKDRGKHAQEIIIGGSLPDVKYGQSEAATGVAGMDLLKDSKMEDAGADADVEEDSDEGDTGDEREEAVNTTHNKGKEDEVLTNGAELRERVGPEVDQTLPEDQTRLFTNADFRRIRELQASNELGEITGPWDTGDAVDPEDVRGLHRKERLTPEERLEAMRAGRDGNSRKERTSRKPNKGGGSSNRAKLKKKVTSMVIHKFRRNSKLSFRDRQLKKRKRSDYK